MSMEDEVDDAYNASFGDNLRLNLNPLLNDRNQVLILSSHNEDYEGERFDDSDDPDD